MIHEHFSNMDPSIASVHACPIRAIDDFSGIFDIMD